MKILVTGAEGFIGKNLCLRLEENGYKDLIKISHASNEEQLISGLNEADFVFHLAGVNRPEDPHEFNTGNVEFTKKLVDILLKKNKPTPVMLSSSIQALCQNAYGISKAEAEKCIAEYARVKATDYFIYRLPNVFGKWCRPDYNSFIATFCHNISRGIDISINDPDAEVSLLYIDDLCSDLISLISGGKKSGYQLASPVYNVTVGEVAKLLYSFKASRENLVTLEVGCGFIRALYATWLSYLYPEQFCYTIPSYIDNRGVFCEMLKTPSAGQFSFFTAHPGITRGGHYHHTKNEKFLVIKGQARFRFEHVVTGEQYELVVNSSSFSIVETVPGWSHDITNIGNDELIVMLWANEIFDREKPDTIARNL